MPNYSYYCKDCDIEYERMVRYEVREIPYECPQCHGKAEYVFPLTRNIWGPIDYHDESLGVDIHGRRHRKEVMKAMGVQEAGDPKGGARNFEESHATGILPPQGISHSDIQRKQEQAQIARENRTVTAIHKDGSERVYRHGDLKSIDDKPVLKAKTE